MLETCIPEMGLHIFLSHFRKYEMLCPLFADCNEGTYKRCLIATSCVISMSCIKYTRIHSTLVSNRP